VPVQGAAARASRNNGIIKIRASPM